jgi:tetratricopeptide (TPR) repeat protein
MVNDVNHSIYEKTAEEYLLEGNRDYQKNKFKEAIKAYEKVIETSIENIALSSCKISFLSPSEISIVSALSIV